ncbi:MAG: hypothetical protein WC558_08305, partial [Patulibacter sp.]
MSTLPLDAPHRRTRHLSRQLRVTALLVVTLMAAILGIARTADAAPFPFFESFRTNTAPDFAFGGNPGSPAILTAGAGDAAGDGWLRLTPALTSRFGYAYHRTAFPSGDGLVFDFDYAAWGGAGSGADGITFALFDGVTTDAQFHPGPVGGSLGYTACNTGSELLPGLSNAYMAVGLDEYGNFANTAFCQQSGASNSVVPHRVSIRGGAPDYQHLRSVIATGGVSASRANARHVTVTVLPKDGATVVSVTIRYPNGTVQPIATDLPLATPPETLKFGFTAGTGGSVNNHEIRNLQVTKPTDLQVAVDAEPASADRNGVQEYVARITNAGPNPATGVDIATTAPDTTDAAWTCTASGGATCAAASGTGLPQGAAGPLPKDGMLSFRITSRLTDDANDSSLRFSADPTGDTTELTPADNVADARSDVTPGIALPPTIALSESGLATATVGTAIGGNLTRSLQWLRCDADGANCAEISGATGTGYLTTDADRGTALRVRETVTNTAGSAFATSVAVTVPGTPVEAEPPPADDEAPMPVFGRPGAAPPVDDVPTLDDAAPAALAGDTPSPALGGAGEPASPSGSTSYAPSTTDGPVAGGPLLAPQTVSVPLLVPNPAAPPARTAPTTVPRTLTVPTTKPFAITRGVVTGPVRRTLVDAAPQLRTAKAVRCVGVTDRRGSSARNRRQAVRQAQAVCRTLRRLGVRTARSATA